MINKYFGCFVFFWFALLAWLNGNSAAFAQCSVSAPVLISPTDDHSGDLNGSSVAVSGDWALVGAPGYDWGGSLGAAHVWRFNGSVWQRTQQLLASNGVYGNSFGSSVALSGDWAIIGAPGRNLSAGAAYVFHRDPVQGWVEMDELSASAPSYNFGWSVAMSGNIAVVGSKGDDSGAGAAYVFRLTGSQWLPEQRLVAAARSSQDYFGVSVAIHDDSIVVGASGDHERGEWAGAGYVFRAFQNGSVWNWNMEAKLLASDAAPNDLFGRSVSIHGGVIAVGAMKNDDMGLDSGSAYVFRFSEAQWSQSQKLVPDDGQPVDRFGTSLAVASDYLLVGASFWNADIYTLRAGKAYYFYANQSASSFIQGGTILPTGSGPDYQFGNAIAVSRGKALIGSITAAAPGQSSGAAFVYNIQCASVLTVRSSFPPNFFVDALEDRDASTSTLYGIKDVSINFSAPVISSGGSALSPGNFTLGFTRNGVAATDLQTGQVPVVSSVSGSGAGPYTVHLSARIPLGAWTKITAINVVDAVSSTPISAAANSIVLGNLPMDITQDGRVLGDDISRWLAIRNGGFPLPAPLTQLMLLDQKRNGVLAGEDITRGIQLINGIGTFRAWSGFDLGARP